jgi:hypothetical protein
MALEIVASRGEYSRLTLGDFLAERAFLSWAALADPFGVRLLFFTEGDEPSLPVFWDKSTFDFEEAFLLRFEALSGLAVPPEAVGGEFSLWLGVFAASSQLATTLCTAGSSVDADI